MTVHNDFGGTGYPSSDAAEGIDHRGFYDQADIFLEQYRTIDLSTLMAQARALRENGHGRVISYSRKVFVPLTRLCRDTCGYCTFATTPSKVASPYLSPDEVLEIAEAGKHAGCHEVLFTLGDKPELRYSAARKALEDLGYGTTVEYLAAMCDLVLHKTGLLPHVNAGLMNGQELLLLRKVSISQGIMLESISEALCERGGPHFGSPDKLPSVRLEMIAAAGRHKIPFTTGILIGIGESRRDQVASLLALHELHRRFGHIQEIIVQNFRAKPTTRMASSEEPGLDDLLWTAAVARIIFGPRMNIQVPPNLSYNSFPSLLKSGINDWGGVSPVTPDHVNPEAPWPALDRLAEATTTANLDLVARLPTYPAFLHSAAEWLDSNPLVRSQALRLADATGFARDCDWAPGLAQEPPTPARTTGASASTEKLIAKALSGSRLTEAEITRLFQLRGGDVDAICCAADMLREKECGDVVRYVVNRNINYTNVCTYRCGFCAFSKGKLSENLRGTPYDLPLEEVSRRAREAWDRGATEVCMQGGINPHYTGATYLELLKAVKTDVPEMHVHAFSPLEVFQGAATLGISVRSFLEQLKEAGLGSLPGTAAEILDDQIRAIIAPDKLSTKEWLDVVGTAHDVGLRTTATVMFGHVERPVHLARHLLAIRDLQERTGGFTEFVPLPFVHMEAPLYAKGLTRKGPTWREVRLMHAIARLVLHPLITNIQASWVKLGSKGVAALLKEGVNDLGGILMNESISRAAGTEHGQEFCPRAMEALIGSLGRIPEQRTTLYQPVTYERRQASFAAIGLSDIVQTPFKSRRKQYQGS